jgi:hypothetical protein
VQGVVTSLWNQYNVVTHHIDAMKNEYDKTSLHAVVWRDVTYSHKTCIQKLLIQTKLNINHVNCF